MYVRQNIGGLTLRRGLALWGITLLICFGVSLPQAASALETVATKSSKYYTINTKRLPDGNLIDETIIHGPPTPPPGFELQRQVVSLPVPYSAAGTNTLSVPAFNWVFGCSAVSGAMIASYYDRNGYQDMYTGPTNGGVMPMDNSSWGTWSDGNETYPNCPLIASHKGVDGRVTKGSIDDYWVQYGSSASDPYITGSWTQHTWADAIGDYMKTSQSAYSNTDGSTSFYNWTTTADPLTCTDMEGGGISSRDGTYGRKLFYEARGYTVTDCYNQKTDNNGGGFTFAMYKAEIDAGRPVFLNLAGHSIVGVGYDDSTNTAYIHDTWDYLTHTMTWGGSYAGMALQSVSIVNLAPNAPAVINTTPADGATGVALNTTIGATFNRPMNSSTITTSTFYLNNGVTGTVGYDAGTNTAIFTPSTNLTLNTTYTATITTGVADPGDSHMPTNKTWNFTTTDGSVRLVFNSTDVPKTIVDLSMVTSTLTVPAGACTNITDINVSMNATHTYVGDLSVTLSNSGSGRSVQLYNHSCSSNDNLIALFDDEAPTAISCPPNGTYQPYSLLSNFDGVDPVGTWTLSITDSVGGDSGTLTNWGISVACPSSRQLSVNFPDAGSGYVTINPGNISFNAPYIGQFSDGAVLTLTATAYDYSDFSSITGGCTTNPCSLTMSSDKTVNANFVLDTANKARIGASNYFGTLPAAYASPSGTTILAWGTYFAEPLTCNLVKNVTIDGGWNDSYGDKSGYTTLLGPLTISQGSLTVEDLTIK